MPMRVFPLLLLLGCLGSDEPVDTVDTHDHSDHSHTGLWPKDTGRPPDSEWLWECTPDWEAGSDLVGAWDAQVSTEGRLGSLQDYTGCQAVFTHRYGGVTNAYLVLFRENVVPDTSRRHGNPLQPTTQLSDGLNNEDPDGASTVAALARGGMNGAFVTTAHNVVAPDPGGEHADAVIFEVELGGRSTEARSLAGQHEELPNGAVRDVALSGDGEWLVFASTATNLDPDLAATAGTQLYARRTRTEATLTRLLTLGTDGESSEPQVSHTGRFVVFTSEATTLVGGDANGLADVFVLDRDPDANGLFEVANRSVVRVSDTLAGGDADGVSGEARISADGRYIVFESDATNLVPGDTNGVRDVFLHDRDSDEDGVYDEATGIATERLSVSTAGVQADGMASHAGVSDDGRWVTFDSTGTTAPLVAGAAGLQVYVRDRTLGTTALVSHDNAGSAAVGGSRDPFISRTGKTMIFVTSSTTYDVAASENDLHFGIAENPIWVEPAAQ